MGYSTERREAVLKKLLPPVSKSVAQLAREEGVSMATLYKWRKEARMEGRLLPDGSAVEGWSSRDKFAAVVESASMSEAELGEYCRQRGVYPEQIKAWRQACEQANDWDRMQGQRLKALTQADPRRIKALEGQLRRKEKALAEAAALLVSRKNVEAIWGARAAA